MDSLADIAARHTADGADPGHGDKQSVHSYIPHYEHLFAPYRERGSILEIGLALGKSLAMWCDWFGPEARIFGVDISIVFSIDDPRVTLIEADATNKDDLTNETFGKFWQETFDIIIDDGSHMQADQEAAFRLLAPRVRPGGLYIIEDILARAKPARPHQPAPELRSH
jgi:predicted O-methyltransferase YrrM